MATNAPIIRNAVRHPRQTAEYVKAHPHQLRDETTETVAVLAKELVRAGHREQLLSVCDAEGSGLDKARLSIIRSACGRHVH